MDLNGFDLNLLRVLNALLQEGSTVKAGARIGLSQPAVSAALARLRHALGDELFVRRGQGLEPTDFARSLAVPLSKALQGIGTLLSGPVAFHPARSRAIFRISGSDAFGGFLAPKLGERISRLAPDMRIHMVDLVRDKQFEIMERYKIDIALQPSAQVPDWADSSRIMSCGFKLITRHGHPALRHAGIEPGCAIPLDLYCDLSHALFSNTGDYRGVGDDVLKQVGRRRKVVISLPFFYGIFNVVNESDLVALVPEQMAESLGSALGLDVYEPPITVPPVELSMIWHRRASANPAHRWLRHQITDILAPIDSLRCGFDTAGQSIFGL